MCSDAYIGPQLHPQPPKRTPGQALDDALEAKDRENADLRRRIADIEAEYDRLRRRVGSDY